MDALYGVCSIGDVHLVFTVIVQLVYPFDHWLYPLCLKTIIIIIIIIIEFTIKNNDNRFFLIHGTMNYQTYHMQALNNKHIEKAWWSIVYRSVGGCHLFLWWAWYGECFPLSQRKSSSGSHGSHLSRGLFLAAVGPLCQNMLKNQYCCA